MLSVFNTCNDKKAHLIVHVVIISWKIINGIQRNYNTRIYNDGFD